MGLIYSNCNLWINDCKHSGFYGAMQVIGCDKNNRLVAKNRNRRVVKADLNLIKT